MSTNNSREILVCRRQVLSREQEKVNDREHWVNTRRASGDDRQREVKVEEEDKMLAKKVGK